MIIFNFWPTCTWSQFPLGLEVADSEDLSARVARRGFQGGPNYLGLNMALGHIYHVGPFAESQLSPIQSQLCLTIFAILCFCRMFLNIIYCNNLFPQTHLSNRFLFYISSSLANIDSQNGIANPFFRSAFHPQIAKSHSGNPLNMS